MIEMKRRYLLATAAACLSTGVAGCADPTGSSKTTDGVRTKDLNLFPTVTKTTEGWSLTVTVRNEDNWDTSFHDLQVLAFTADGTKISDVDAGDLIAPGGDSTTVEITCPEFPAIITATARETPCRGALIPVLRWVGTDAQRMRTGEPEEVWEDSYRKCGEQVPPKRLLHESDDGERSTAETSTDD